jgi:hypothetical protein
VRFRGVLVMTMFERDGALMNWAWCRTVSNSAVVNCDAID